MALSVHQSRTGSVWPLGFVKVTTPGAQVCFMLNTDSANNQTPSAGSNNITEEYTPVFRGFGVQAYKPAANNNGTVANTGNIYLMFYPAGGAGNRADYGAMIKTIPSGSDWFFPPEGIGADLFSPYSFFLDADNGGDGAIVTLYGGVNP